MSVAQLWIVAVLVTPQEFEPPVRIEGGSGPVDADVGHAAPFVYDFDRDGVDDLLVGQFGEGKLRVYRNVGTNKAPRFAGFEWFHAGGQIGQVPAG